MKSQNGNAFIYILVAVAMFAALMFTMSKSSQNDDPTAELDVGKSKIAANEILSYAAAVTNNEAQLLATGVQTNQIDFMLPNDADFNNDTVTNPNRYKFFHPSGGGMSYKTLPSSSILDDGMPPNPGYYVGRFNNVEWTPTTAMDILFVAYEIKTSICEEINRKITGSTAIPTVTGDSLENLFIDDSLHAGTNADFLVTNCAACEEKPSLCVQNGSGTNAFYSVIEAE